MSRLFPTHHPHHGGRTATARPTGHRSAIRVPQVAQPPRNPERLAKVSPDKEAKASPDKDRSIHGAFRPRQLAISSRPRRRGKTANLRRHGRVRGRPRHRVSTRLPHRGDTNRPPQRSNTPRREPTEPETGFRRPWLPPHRRANRFRRIRPQIRRIRPQIDRFRPIRRRRMPSAWQARQAGRLPQSRGPAGPAPQSDIKVQPARSLARRPLVRSMEPRSTRSRNPL